MDWIWLRGVKCRLHLGVSDAERRRRQQVVLDVGLETDASPSGRSDDLAKAVDYWKVETALRQGLEGRPWRLLEAAAEEAARLVFRCDPRVSSVKVAASKRPAVMPKTSCVVVEILRRRD